MESETRNSLRGGWLGKVPASFADALLNAGATRSFADGDVIYGLGQDQACLWGVATGLVRMWVTMNEQPPRFGHVAGPGFWFGESEFVFDRPGIMEMVAAGDTTLLMVTRGVFSRIAGNHADAWPAVARLAVLNQGLAIGAADDLMIRDSRKRLVAVLLRLAGHRNAFQGGVTIPTVPVTQLELAEASSLSRSSAAQILGDLARQGKIRTDYRTISILDPEALAAMLAE